MEEAYSTYLKNAFVGSMLRTLCVQQQQQQALPDPLDAPETLSDTAKLASKCRFHADLIHSDMEVSARHRLGGHTAISEPLILMDLLAKVIDDMTGGVDQTAASAPDTATPGAMAGADGTTTAQASSTLAAAAEPEAELAAADDDDAALVS